MIERARQVGFDHQFLKLARQINESMPTYTVDLLIQGFKKLNLSLNKTQVALLGLAYKKDVADLRNSPALVINQLLQKKKIPLNTYDPFITKLSTTPSFQQALNKSQVVMLACDHTSLVKKLTPKNLAKNKIKLVVDGKNALDAEAIAAVGIPYYGIGRTYTPEKQH
jgi:UDP-N-acetyl-D-mannosaminuronate dehydrogenase